VAQSEREVTSKNCRINGTLPKDRRSCQQGSLEAKREVEE